MPLNPVKAFVHVVAVATALVSLSHATLAQSSGKAVILSINDVYQIEGVDGAKYGGMPRVRALRAELERTSPDLLFRQDPGSTARRPFG